MIFGSTGDLQQNENNPEWFKSTVGHCSWEHCSSVSLLVVIRNHLTVLVGTRHQTYTNRQTHTLIYWLICVGCDITFALLSYGSFKYYSIYGIWISGIRINRILLSTMLPHLWKLCHIFTLMVTFSLMAKFNDKIRFYGLLKMKPFNCSLTWWSSVR